MQLGGIRTFWSIMTFLDKNSYMKIPKAFRVILILYAQFLAKNVLIFQTVSIPLNCILPTHPSTKYPDTPQLYSTSALFNKMFQYHYIVYYRHSLLQLFKKHWIYFFFLILGHEKIPPSISMLSYRH